MLAVILSKAFQLADDKAVNASALRHVKVISRGPILWLAWLNELSR